METYLARLSLSCAFAQSRLGELGAFWRPVAAALPASSSPEMLRCRFTYAAFRLEAENAAACEDAVRAAWIETMGSAEGLAEIHVVQQRGDDTDALMTSILCCCFGVEDYLRLTVSLAAQIPYLRERGALGMLIRQNIILSIDPGCGFTTLLASFGDFLHRMRVYPEEQYESRTHYVEIEIGKESEDGRLSADDVIERLEASREDNTYNVIGFDVSYYLEGNRTDALRRFLERLRPFEDWVVFVFRIPFLEKRAYDRIRDVFADVMPIRQVRVPPHPDCVLMEYIWNQLTDSGMSLEAGAIDAVCDMIHEEKRDARIYGFRSAEKIACELVMKKAARYAAGTRGGGDADPVRVAAADLAGPGAADRERATGYAALGEMIGMEKIAARIREIVTQIRTAMENERLDRPSIHMRFTGAPGTGKTTVARILGQILREEGILRRGGFFEYSARELIAEYVGQTAVKTATACRDAYGSVLFIDEAYALWQGGRDDGDYGREALTTLISEMENHRDDMLVIMAGYTDEMEELMKANPGLRSRMPFVIEFPSYTRAQLFEIFMSMVRGHFDYAPSLEAEARAYFAALSDEYVASKEFANARFVRNLYERTWSKGALRASLAGVREIILTREDFLAASSEKEFSEKLEHSKTVGF